MPHSSPGYQPRRRVSRAGTRRQPASGRHRAVRRFGRIGALTAAFAITATVAIAAVTAAPREPAVAGVGTFDFDTAAMATAVRERVDAMRVNPGSRPARGAEAADADALPADSGEGKRIVFEMSTQRVWLVRDDGKVARTYEVSGSKHDNLKAGTYEVFSKSRHARSFDLESTMDYFVRFTEGENAAIGFHDIPVDPSGKRLQTKDELGTALSSGCIRQARPDAVALWTFAPVGTDVVVLA